MVFLRSASSFLALAIAVLSEGQAGQWTWMKGDSAAFPVAVYGTSGGSSPFNTPGGVYEGTEWKDLNGNFWLYDNHDMWMFDPTGLDWTWFGGSQGTDVVPSYGVQGTSSASNHPGWRRYGSASWVDASNNLWLYGGEGLSGVLNDLWRYSIPTHEWTWMKGDSIGDRSPHFGVKGTPGATVNPGGVSETSASWVDDDENLWFFGGEGFDSVGILRGVWNTLWKYSPPTNEWTWISGDSVLNSNGNYGVLGIQSETNQPRARRAYAKWKTDESLWLFGGSSGLELPMNDLWKFDLVSEEWTWLGGSAYLSGDSGMYAAYCDTSGSNYPRARHESRSAWTDYAGNLWLFGGGAYVNGTISMNDLWMYEPTHNTWTWVEGPSLPNWDPPHYGLLQVADANNEPGSRRGAVSWVDAWGDLWLFGGRQSGKLNDLWRYRIDEACVDIDTYIQEIQSTPSFEVYPNPFSGAVELRFELLHPGDMTIDLVNAQGQTVSTMHYQRMTKGEHTIRMGSPELQPGRYLIVVRHSGIVVVQKLVKSE